MWVIVTMSAVMCLIGVVVELGNLWMARAELHNALEAGALSAVDTWGDAGPDSVANQTAARTQAVALVQLNTVNGQPVTISSTDVTLGNLTGASPFVFQPNQTITGDRGAQIQAAVTVNSIIGKLCGNALGPYQISTQVTARYDSNSPKTVRIQ